MFGVGYVSRYVSAMFRRYTAIDKRDVVGVCVGVCIGGSHMRFSLIPDTPFLKAAHPIYTLYVRS